VGQRLTVGVNRGERRPKRKQNQGRKKPQGGNRRNMEKKKKRKRRTKPLIPNQGAILGGLSGF